MVRGALSAAALGCAVLLGAACGAPVRAEAWTPSAEERARLADGEVIVHARVRPQPLRGEVRAAVQIGAPAEQVFRTMTDCGQALQFVPHLERCEVLEAAPDGTWQTVAHRVDYSWLLPPADYIFRTELEPFRRIRFFNVSGDFLENDGHWELQPLPGAATLLTYEVRIAPRFYVPRWLLRGALRRELPGMLRALRRRAERYVAPVTVSEAPLPAPEVAPQAP